MAGKSCTVRMRNANLRNNLNEIQERKLCLVFVSTFSLLAVVFKALLREQETRHAIEDAEIKGLELQAQKEMLQQVCVRHVGPSEQKVVFPWGHASPTADLVSLLSLPDSQKCHLVKPIPDPL